MGDLSTVPEEKIVDYLLERLEHGWIYTWVGTLLLAINPNNEIITGNTSHLPHSHEYDNICNVIHKEVSPHIFAVAARAHYRIVQGLGKPSQVIVLSGETGTGKTFNAWKALEFLTKSISFGARERRDIVVTNNLQRISDACHLISAFTTAPTERNEVSSRHVQLVWLEYKLGNVCGATISSYLLERSRVTKGCCNFRIFSQMMTNVKFADTKLVRERRYFMLGDLDFLNLTGLSNDFYKTLRAMDVLGFTDNHKKDIFLLLSLLIHMGDIQFIQEDDYCRIDTNSLQSRKALKNTCRLACVEKEDIIELLTSTLINPGSIRRRHGIVCRRNLDSDVCRYRLHSIIRHLYDLLIHWLINFINEILSNHLFSERLGILDTFGFECFKSNDIEQFCINYANERLQQYFVEKYLVSHQNDLQQENFIGDELSEIMQSYKYRIYTIEKFLFTTLNDMCLSTVPNNSSILIRQVHARSCPATRQVLNIRNQNFVVRHYCGTAEYSVCDLLSKNTDKIPDEISVTFSTSKNKFLYSLINKSKPYHNGKAKKPTMLSKLRCNVDLLIEELNKCDAHYVRCIEPRRLNGHEWDRNELYKQLANANILDALRLARCKYPIHFVYKDFFKRYKKHTATDDLRIACKNILESFRITMDNDNSSVYYGKRFIFLKETIFLRLEFFRRRHRAECVEKIESFWIKHKKNYQQNKERKNVADGVCVIENTDIQHELIEKSEHELVLSEINSYAEKNQSQDIKDIASNVESIIIDDIEHKESQFERSPLEYDRILSIQDCPRFRSRNYIELLTTTVKRKTAYILHWLDGVNKATNIKPSVLELQENNYNQSIDTNCNKKIQLEDTLHKPSNKNKLLTPDRCETYSSRYNEKEDMYIIAYGVSTLFYKNGVLSRHRPARLPIKIDTRLSTKCLTNFHYLHTELPLGLQDCL